jgi:protein-disulfide isomerase
VNKHFLLVPFLLLSCTKASDPDPTAAPAPSACADGNCGKKGAEEVPPAVQVPVEGLPTFGSSRALVTLAAFTDYECPFCARADGTIDTLRREYGDKLRVVVASSPLPIHDHATPAARAFLAAVEQGKGEEMHRRLFANQRALDDEGLRASAAAVGLDLARYDRDLQEKVPAALARATNVGASLGVSGTPTFFVNGRRLVGARPIETFRALIDEELAKAESLVKSGIRSDRVYETLMQVLPKYTPSKMEKPEDDEIKDVPLGNAPTRGPSRAPITLVFFSDFECPFCVRAEGTLRELESRGDVRIAFRHRPLPMHPHARLAAKAAIAAERQGRFWQYHDIVVAHREALERADLERYAAEAGLDRARFDRDLDDAAVEARLVEDEQLATELGVKGTPTSFVNGRRVTGAQSIATFQSVVTSALRREVRTVQ